MTGSDHLRERHRTAVAQGVATRSIYADRASNGELWDVDGKHYIDFAAGIAVLNTGHRHPRVMAAIAEQAEKFTHTCFHVAPFEGYIRLAERLNALAPVAGPAKTMLVSTGAEAVENAVKIARIATGRSSVVAFSGSFHGRTMMGMALTGKVFPYKRGFGPFPADIFHVAFPNEYHGGSTEASLAALKALFRSDVDPARVAAIVIEPIQGEGGFVPAPVEFLRALRQVCDEHGILLIVDEVQAGMARTGKMFAIEHASVEADIVTLAKGIAGGFPLSAVVGRADVMDAAHPGGLGGTYAGNPVSVAAANAVLDVIAEENLCERAAAIGARMRARLEAMAKHDASAAMGDIRGAGAMLAVEFVRDNDAEQPDAELAAAIVAEAELRGLIVLVCGTRANVIRFLPPLTVDDMLVDNAMDILEASLHAALASRSKAA